MDKVRFSETGYKDYTRPYKVGGAARQYRGWQVDILFTLSIFCLGCFFLNKPRNFSNTLDWNRQKVVITHDPCRMA